jgi:hypothetical protein
MSQKTQAAKRRSSFVEIASNPLESGEKDQQKDKIEIIGNARIITSDELQQIKIALEAEKYL